jgi:putative SOS response-associated peptidase YedK
VCGRYVQASSPSLLAERFAVDEIRVPELEQRFNITPRSDVPIVAVSRERRVLDLVRWGLVPSWAKDLKIGDRLINARAESIATKPAYKRAFQKRRCIVPADGFYEWRKVPGHTAKQPYFVYRRDREPLAFAGLWEIWHDPEHPDGERIRSCVIVTTRANHMLEPVHDRMPVVLPEEVWDAWLDPENHDTTALEALLVPAPDDVLDLYAVRPLVNRPTNDGRELLEPAPADEILA